jgi:hypothetical protein
MSKLKRLGARLRAMQGVRQIKSVLRSPLALRARLRDRATAGRWKHELAIAAIFKNEAPYLDEWLCFHHGIGATQFYLYNNNSTDDYRSVLAPWIARDLVTLIDWPRVPGQRSAYRHCFRAYWREARWIAVVDIDEYLFSPKQADIRPILRSLGHLKGIFVYLLSFGSSGHVRKPEGGTLASYTRRHRFGAVVTGKSIVNPRWVRDVPNAHYFSLWGGRYCNTSELPASSPGARKPGDGAPVYDVLRINHYWSRSLEELEAKSKRDDAFYGGSRPHHFKNMYTNAERMNAEEDRCILAIWDEIRSAVPDL